MTGYYAVRNEALPQNWRDSWLGATSRSTTAGIVTHISGITEMSVGSCGIFSTIEEARSFAMLVTMKMPTYLGRLAIYHIEWDESMHRWTVGKRTE